ncbi:MAG: Fur family transcriptional regulator [Nitriliruptorales bacterium]|nr:Fur family transcriptional regulator [Nitriliruptorales bacterium]
MVTDDIRGLLRRGGYRVTQPRREVWRALNEADGHLTVEEITERVHDRDPGINLASVYRSLAVFEELDLVRESRLGDEDASRWELSHPDEHFHLVCDECGRIDHHRGSLVEEIRDHLVEGHGFEPSGVELIVTGRCADCTTGDRPA